MVLMNRVFHKHLHDFVNVFVDDILIYSDNEEDYERHLRTTLEVVRENNFYAERNKCEFRMKEVSFLWHIISKEGVSVDPFKGGSISGSNQDKGNY